MAAFDRIKSGIPEMDSALDNIRLGDNVVWRVSDLSEFKLFMEPYLKQAKEDKRNIIYFRFASHEPLVEDCPEVKTIEVPLSHRFETFTVDIHNAIEREGYDAFYVFDCLSELQAAWATDLMMGNFFRVTCPFLFILDTVAFFPIIRGKHSVQAINKILDTTQLFIDVYSDNNRFGITGMTIYDAMGCGVQLGTQEYESETKEKLQLLSKQVVIVVLPSREVDNFLEFVEKCLYTGHIGDGKIFVTPVTNAIRVRTGEEGMDALVEGELD